MTNEYDEEFFYDQKECRRRPKQKDAIKKELSGERFFKKYNRAKYSKNRHLLMKDSSTAISEQNDDRKIPAEFQDYWGIAAAIDIYHCTPEKIRDAELIRTFVVELCELIDMRRFGETQVVNFGEDDRVAGYSMLQLIETSLISAHFANLSNTTYLDVFSCKTYDPEKVRNFAQNFFGGAYSILNVTYRR